MTEVDKRIEMVQTILDTPHGELDRLFELHKQFVEVDPLFYSKFAIYYGKTGSIRDHKKIFASHVLTGSMIEVRELGEFLLTDLTPYDVVETVDLILKFRGSGGKKRRLNKVIKKYLRDFERDAKNGNSFRFLKNANALRKMYQRLHVKPSEEASASLGFRDGDPGKKYESFLDMEKLTTLKEESEICQMISESQIPALQIFGALPVKITPAIAASMISKMSPQEIQNFAGMLQKQGLFEDPEFKKLFKQKVKKGGAKMSMRGTSAKKSLGKDSDIMDEATDSFVESLPTIKRKIGLYIDRSNSMTQAIAMGKDIASILASKVENPEENLFIVAFNSTCQKIPVPTEKKYSEFELTFRFMNANGTTSLGAPIKFTYENGFEPETFIFITDGKETDVPLLDNILKSTPKLAHTKMIFCKVGKDATDVKVSTQKDLGLEIENLDFRKGDYYGLPNLLNLISKGGIRDLIQEIDNIDLFEEIRKRREAA